MQVAVIAFGTRGDVQPLVVLAAGMVERCSWCSSVVLLTHEQHALFVQPLLALLAGPNASSNSNGSSNNNETKEGFAKLKFAKVDSPPVIWRGT